MFEEDIVLLNSFHTNAGHSKNTIKTYRTALNKYSEFHDMSLKNLLAEAIFEQENKIAENKLKVYDRISSFRQFLVDNHIGNTVTTTLPKIKTFYRYHRVKLPYFHPINSKNLKHHDFISYGDLLSKGEILKGLRIANDDLKDWILVMVSSGASRMECKSMTNRMFFEGTYSYHKKDSFIEALRYLSCHDNVVCTCKLLRKKTDKPYYTFLNPECVQIIARHKLLSGDFDLDSPLLRYSENYMGRKCKFINDYLDFGYAGGYSRFRPHMFRKFHSTQLNRGLSMDEVDFLQGRGKTSTRESYFKDDPEVLKLKYVSVMNNVSLFNHYDVKIENDEIVINAMYGSR